MEPRDAAREHEEGEPEMIREPMPVSPEVAEAFPVPDWQPQTSDAAFSPDEEKRIRRIVYCGEQFLGKRIKLWQARYDRAMADAQSVEELDEAMRRLDAKFPHLNLREYVEAQRG